MRPVFKVFAIPAILLLASCSTEAVTKSGGGDDVTIAVPQQGYTAGEDSPRPRPSGGNNSGGDDSGGGNDNGGGGDDGGGDDGGGDDNGGGGDDGGGDDGGGDDGGGDDGGGDDGGGDCVGWCEG